MQTRRTQSPEEFELKQARTVENLARYQASRSIEVALERMTWLERALSPWADRQQERRNNESEIHP